MVVNLFIQCLKLRIKYFEALSKPLLDLGTLGKIKAGGWRGGRLEIAIKWTICKQNPILTNDLPDFTIK